MSQTEPETTTEQPPEPADVEQAPEPADVEQASEPADAEQAPEPADAEQASEPADAIEPGPEVQEADLPEAQDACQAPGGGQIDILLDSPMTVTVCLGQARPVVRDLLEMGPGSVLTLDRQVGEPIDLFLRGVRFATGHLVVVDDHLGVRIKEILATGQDAEE